VTVGLFVYDLLEHVFNSLLLLLVGATAHVGPRPS
jgi:hypothetical protein